MPTDAKRHQAQSGHTGATVCVSSLLFSSPFHETVYFPVYAAFYSPIQSEIEIYKCHCVCVHTYMDFEGGYPSQ